MENRWFDRISEYLDGEMSTEDERLFEARLAEDAELSRAVRETRAVLRDAKGLPDIDPPASVWEAVSERIESAAAVGGAREAGDEPFTAQHRPRVGRRGPSRALDLKPLQALAAALALVIVSGVGGYLLRGSSNSGPAPVELTQDAPPEGSVAVPGGVDPGFASAGRVTVATTRFDEEQEHLATSILQLEVLLRERGHLLDEDTRSVVVDNLIVIDEAIRDARAALGDTPDSDFLRTHLARSMKSKVRLLEDATRLTRGEI